MYEHTVHQANFDGTNHKIFLRSSTHSIGVVDGMFMDLWLLTTNRTYFSERNGVEQKCLGYIMVMTGFSVFFMTVEPLMTSHRNSVNSSTISQDYTVCMMR